MEAKNIHLDHRIIYSIIEPDSRVLDLGCGEGDLLYPLVRDKHVRAQGIELDDKAIQECVKKGLSVFHDDIESSLREYPDQFLRLRYSEPEHAGSKKSRFCHPGGYAHRQRRSLSGFPISPISNRGLCCFSGESRPLRNHCPISGMIHPMCAF